MVPGLRLCYERHTIVSPIGTSRSSAVHRSHPLETRGTVVAVTALLAIGFFVIDFVTDFGDPGRGRQVQTAAAAQSADDGPDLSQVELGRPTTTAVEVVVEALPVDNEPFTRWAAVIDPERLDAPAPTDVTAEAEVPDTTAAPASETTVPPATDPPAPPPTEAPPPPSTTQAPPPPPPTEPPAPPSVDGLSASDLATLRNCESGGNYSAYNPSGPYMGAYQFGQSAWNGTANWLGRGDLVGMAPSNASPAVQDAMAVGLWRMSGPGQWPHCGAHLPPKP